MFIDHTPSIQPTPPVTESTPLPVSLPWWKRRRTIILAASIFGLVIIAAAVWFFLFRQRPSAPVKEQPDPAQSILPGNLQPSKNDTEGNGGVEDFKGENITFGSFYKPLDKELSIKLKAVSLPLNAKRDISNFYEVSRKVSLDAAVSSLNANGFALTDMPFSETKADFFGTYAQLGKNGIPLLISSDFLAYYYQNSLKEIYKDLEASYFYDSVWKVNKQLFDAANSRYQERRQKLGVSNDPLLEAERLEASYAAVALTLLAPTADQRTSTEDLNDATRFKPSEAQRYQFTVPSYLADDVAKEVALIRGAKQTAKSPLFLYARDYTVFRTPAEYASSAQLKNFYAAKIWQSTLFPLSYRSAACADCLLDKDDWTIDQTAAFLLAADMGSSQSLRNEWARIYKVMGYFNGLRRDLTYLDYEAVRAESFPGKSVEEIFSTNAFASLEGMVKKLAALDFPPAEGGVDRSIASQKKDIGLRLLQTSFSPEPYLYSRLTFSAVGNHNKPDYDRSRGQYLSACVNQKDKTTYRCKGIGFDILAGAVSLTPASVFISDNLNYRGYASARAALARELGSFTVDAWHSTAFWTSLDISRSLLKEDLPALPYARTKSWDDRQLQLGLSFMTSVSLPLDQWESNRSTATNQLGSAQNAEPLAYVEPGQALIDELNANTDMLFKTLAALGVVKNDDIPFSELKATLSGVRDLSRKELSGEALSADDARFLADLAFSHTLGKAGPKNTTIAFTEPGTKQVRTTKHSIAPLKLMWLVYERDGRKVLAAGPVFSYKEE